jgi:hypothetical protein
MERVLKMDRGFKVLAKSSVDSSNFTDYTQLVP